MKLFYFVNPAFLLLLVHHVSCDNWAVLVAGSKDFYNYRHQADICHAYQILHKHGVPDSNIIVMMYDDIAHNLENPHKGVIINKPDGPNVYPGVLKDYTGHAVTPRTFLNVLKGISEHPDTKLGSGKVLKSGPNDNVFVFFADHGAPGLIAFPDGKSLHAQDLNDAIKYMFDNKKYKNLVLYIEACESGSMFDGILASNMNVYAVTASNPYESSFACYYDNSLNTYLGDVFSVMWMEDSDSRDITRETLLDQFTLVRNETNTSHVMSYGQQEMASEFNLSDFLGSDETIPSGSDSNFKQIQRNTINSRLVRLDLLQKKLHRETNSTKITEILSEYENLLNIYKRTKSAIQEIASIVYSNEPLVIQKVLSYRTKIINHECYTHIVDRMTSKCFDLRNEEVLNNLYIIVNLCEFNGNIERIHEAVEMVCKSNKKVEYY